MGGTIAQSPVGRRALPPEHPHPHPSLSGAKAAYNQRAAIIEQLAEHGVDFRSVAAQASKPDADPFGLLCHLAFNAPALTHRQRVARVKKQQAAFFAYHAPEAREILNDPLEENAADGEVQFTLPDVLKVPPISSRGNVNEIMGRFGGAAKIRNIVNQL